MGMRSFDARRVGELGCDVRSYEFLLAAVRTDEAFSRE